MSRTKSQKQESRVAQEMKANVVIASGALWTMKGDVRDSYFLIECKTTEASFYSLHSKTWDKIHQEAIRDSIRLPLMQIDLLDGDQQLAVIRYEDFVGLGFHKFNLVTNNLDVGRAKSFRIKGDYLYSRSPELRSDVDKAFKDDGHAYPIQSFTFMYSSLPRPVNLIVLKWEDFREMLWHEMTQEGGQLHEWLESYV